MIFNVTGYSLFNEPEQIEPELPTVYSNLLTQVICRRFCNNRRWKWSWKWSWSSASKITITLGEYRKRKHEEITSNAKRHDSTSRVLFTNHLPYLIDLHIMSPDGKSYDCGQNEFLQVFINPLFSDLMSNVIKWQIIRKHHAIFDIKSKFWLNLQIQLIKLKFKK